MLMAYRKVGWLEQIYYIVKYRIQHGSPKKLPKKGANMKNIFRASGKKTKSKRGGGIDNKRAQ